MVALSERFNDALVWVVRLHAGQVRKGTSVPYIAHLLAVTALTLEHGADEDEAIAALLHDAVEDQGGEATLAEIQARFGDRIARVVDECSDSRRQPKPPWAERKRAYLEHLPGASDSARLISACDKLHNAQAILRDLRVEGDRLWGRFNPDRDQVLWYYQTLADVFRRVGPCSIGHELNRVVAEIAQLAASVSPEPAHKRAPAR